MVRCLLLLILLSPSQARADDGQSDTSEDSVFSSLALRLRYSSQVSFWWPGQNNSDPGVYGDVLEYHTAVIPSQVFDGELRWKAIPLWRLTYERPFSLSEDAAQRAAVQVSDRGSALVKLQAVADLQILQYLAVPLLEYLGFLRLDYEYHHFFGTATAVFSTQFVDQDGQVTALSPGHAIRVASKFAELSANARVFAEGPSRLFVGVYESTIKKPHETATMEPQLVDATITSIGGKIVAELAWLTFDFNLGWARFRSSNGLLHTDGADVQLRAELHPRFFLVGSSEAEGRGKASLVVMPTLGVQAAVQIGGPTNGNTWALESDGSNEVSGDFVFDLGLSVRLQL